MSSPTSGANATSGGDRSRSGRGRANGRIAGLLPAILMAIGGFALAAALMLVFVVVPANKVTPLDVDSLSVTEKDDATLLDSAAFASGKPTGDNAQKSECKPAEEAKPEEPAEGEDEPAEDQAETPKENAVLPMSCFMSKVPLVSQRQVYGVEPGNKDETTFQAVQSVVREDRLDAGDEKAALVSATKDRVTLDRKTAEPVADNNGSVELIDSGTTGEAPGDFHRDGLQYKWPFDPKNEDYPYFDQATFTTNPIHFKEESEVDGVKVNVYEQEIGPIDMYTSIGAHLQAINPGFSQTTNSILASYRIKGTAGAWGLPGDAAREVQMSRFYTNHRTIKVSKVTGRVLDGREEQFQFFAENQGEADQFWNDKTAVEQERNTPTRTAIDLVAQWDQPSIDRAVDSSNQSASRINTFGRVLPISLGIIGFLFVIGGVLVARRRG
ncbi:DUF3068 domain-containing protein [Dietzia sp.]|uniref:DUF3068 domain-containing protein n=1 Tax=Dietzia sp. TaxID=1871616 RepID=UPI002FD95AD8